MDAVLDTLVRIAEFIIAFGLLVFLHEFGHYIMAKLFNIEVEEFGFGFPPRMLRLFKFRETEFTLNWIPFGAFVRPKGENDPNVPGGLASASPWARLAVLGGGSLMNLATGVLLFGLVFNQVGVANRQVVLISDVAENTPASQAGIQPNDEVLTANGVRIDSMDRLRQVVDQNLGKEIPITLKRGNETIETSATPRANPPAGQGALGIVMSNPVRQVSWLEAIPQAVSTTIDQGRQLITLPVMLIRGQLSAEEGRLVGPKGIYDIYQEARSRDQEGANIPAAEQPSPWLNRLGLLATLSVALGYTNLLPIPALDGGRILFVLPEILLRRRVPAQYENMIHLIGFAALILLMIYITTQDIINPIQLP